MTSLQDYALSTLDVLHLTIMTHQHIQTLATADQTMIEAARALKSRGNVY